jgi:hypothetical protein
MTPRPAHARSGITLTEVLISILIMGVGLISLATLFPLGLVRLREAQRQSRSGTLGESVIGDMGSKNLLAKTTFFDTYYFSPNPNFLVDPFLIDDPFNNNNPVTASYATGGGLPVCYDPLWRYVTGTAPPFSGSLPNGVPIIALFPGGIAEARFGAAIFGTNSFVRNDPQGGAASAYGLQRITNFVPWSAVTSAIPFTYPNPVAANNPIGLRDFAAETFVSPEDVVMQNDGENQAILDVRNPAGNPVQGASSGVVPQFFQVTNAAGTVTGSESRSDWRFTWLFTGRQIDILNGTQFDGDIVIMENRPFSLDQVVSPLPPHNTSPVPAGEIVVEAIFGYGTRTPTVPGYAFSGDRTVLLRWPAAMVDPEFKVGSWIADVTYERNQAVSTARLNAAVVTGTPYPYQRCHWYQIAKRSDVSDETVQGVHYRRMIVYTTMPLKERTLLANGDAFNLNVALFMPSVVNVFQKTFYVR